jgi:hypothetical protein
MVNMKVLMCSNFSKKKWKKMKSPSSMRNGRFTLPSVGARFKKWECYTPILLNFFRNLFFFKIKKYGKRGVSPQSVEL